MTRHWPTLVLLVLASAGCRATISDARSHGGDAGAFGDPDDPQAKACAAAPIDVPPATLERMSAKQYLNTARTLFQKSDLALELDSTDAPVITQLEAEKLNDAAATAVATGGHLRFLPCDATGAGSDACAQKFISDFGLRAFRRPVEADETTWLMGVFHNAKNLQGVTPPITFREAIDTVAQVMVQSPQHLYVSAQGVADSSLPAGLRRMTGYERATRLAYFMTDSMPDDALMQAAANGDLDSEDGVRAQAERLLQTPAGHALVRRFASEYLGLNATTTRPSLENIPKSSTRFPYDSPALRAAMRNESEALYEHVFFEEQGSFAALMTSTEALVNGPLASLYGVSSGPKSADSYAWVNLDGSQRAGIFTRAAFLTENGAQEYQSPIRRGVHLYEKILCLPLSPPPANVNNVPPVPGGSGGQALSMRQQVELKTSPAMCTACHGQFNALGFALENYGAMGQWQTADTGTNPDGSAFSAPINSVATLGGTDIAGTLNGGVGLSQKLAQSTEARDCLAEHWFTTLVNRPAADQDVCSVLRLRTAFRKSGDMQALVLDAASSPPALYVRAAQ